MFSLFGILLFIPLLVFMLLLTFGAALARRLFGGPVRRRPVRETPQNAKQDNNRRQRIKSQFKQDGEYVDFEEVSDKVSD